MTYVCLIHHTCGSREVSVTKYERFTSETLLPLSLPNIFTSHAQRTRRQSYSPVGVVGSVSSRSIPWRHPWRGPEMQELEATAAVHGWRDLGGFSCRHWREARSGWHQSWLAPRERQRVTLDLRGRSCNKKKNFTFNCFCLERHAEYPLLSQVAYHVEALGLPKALRNQKNVPLQHWRGGKHEMSRAGDRAEKTTETTMTTEMIIIKMIVTRLSRSLQRTVCFPFLDRWICQETINTWS